MKWDQTNDTLVVSGKIELNGQGSGEHIVGDGNDLTITSGRHINLTANNNIVLGIDGLGLFMVLLTTFLIPVCLILSFSLSNLAQIKEYNIAFLVLESILLGVFSTLDVLLFYLLFEAVLIPMYFIVGVYGSRGRRVRASYLLFLYLSLIHI